VERELAAEEPSVRLEQGVYRVGDHLRIRLNAAHRARGNGVELDPAEPLPEPPQRSLRVSLVALRRWLAAAAD
jgi:hypothetical protein